MYILGIISMVLFAFCFIPQIVVILRTKAVAGISTLLLLMVVAGHATGLGYVISVKTPILIATYSIGLLSSSTILTLVLYYKRKNDRS